MPALTRKLRYALWVANAYLGREVFLDIPQKATVLITYYHPARMAQVEPQVRNILKCHFVDRLVLSNHNPEVNIEEKVKIKDRRLHFINQKQRRGCGYRWFVAQELSPDYLIVVDDDILFFPGQLARLFRQLVAEPMRPHGITGMLQQANADLEYHEKKEMVVDFLCEAYAVTGAQVSRYLELRNQIAKDEQLAEMIDSAADFMVISQTGSQKPKIHHVGRLFKSDTFKQAGVAVHKNDGFDKMVSQVGQALSHLAVEHSIRLGNEPRN